jgi:hypothetical protein
MRAFPDQDALLDAVLDRFDGPAAIVDAERTIRAANAEFRARCASDPIGRRCHDVLHGRCDPCPPDDVECPLRPGGAGSPVAPRHWHRVGSGVRSERVLVEAVEGREGALAACLARFRPDGPGPRAAGLPALRDLELDIRPFRLELRRAALSQRPVLLLGEPGTRLPRVAMALHRLSRRRGPFEERAACELTRGRLADLVRSEPRPPRPATLHVRDVHELDGRGWSALAAWIGNGEPAPRRGFRVVASSDRGVGEIATEPGAAGAAAVLARLRVRVPAVRERGDLPLLVARALREASGRRSLSLSPEAYAVIGRYAFPGNVDELEGALGHAAVLAGGSEVRVEHLPDWLR